MVVAQPVSAPLTRAAIFLVVMINPGPENRAAVRSFCADVGGLIRAVEFRDLEAGLSCVIGIGSDAWDRLFGKPRPAELHPFREVRAGPRHAVSTPGDLMFHIRAKRMDLCFEMAAQIMARLAGAVTAIDEVHGFRYFDDRDLLGFVDGTENPRGEALIDAALIGEEDPAFAGGSYVRAEISARSAWMERAVHGGTGTHHRPHQAGRYRTGRLGKADVGAQRAQHDHGEWERAQDSARQHAVRQRRHGRVRHLLHRLLPHAAGDRTDDREHVHRPPARQL